MSQDFEPTNEYPRIAELVARFHEIGQTAMRDLPLYNPALEVEAVGFRLVEGHWIGVLVTPWFMNLMRLPEHSTPMDARRMGGERKVVLPSGETDLMQGGDESIGYYESLPLHSPMFAFNTREEARGEADRLVHAFLAAPDRPDADDKARLPTETSKMSRRAFLRGARPES